MRGMVLLAVLLAIWIAMPLGAQTNANAVYMTVNDEPVYAWEVRFTIPQVQAEMSRSGVQPKREDLLVAAVKQAIELRLLAQEARRLGLKPESSRVESTLAQIEEQAGGRDGLDTVLEGLGGTHEQLRANVAESDLVQVYIATQIEPRVTVTPQEVATFYDGNPEKFARPETVRARHILIRISPRANQAAKDSAKARAKAAHDRVVAGENFAAVATEVSEEQNASRGGDLGYFARDSMVPALTDVAFALDIGEISGVIETQFGYHILKVEDKRAASTVPYAEAKIPLERVIRENKIGALMAERLAELVQEATIVRMDSPSGGAVGSGG